MRGLLAFCLLTLSACAPHSPSLLDSDLAAYLPASTAALAGIDVARLRGTPLYDKLPVRDVAYAVAASDGKDWLVVARGQLPGGTAVAPGITAIGADNLVRAAADQHRTGKSGVPDLVAQASDAPFWLVARGNLNLPLTGNLSNINRLLRQTEYLTVAAHMEGDRLAVEATGHCRSAEQATHLEENVRALASLLLAKYPVEVRSEGAVVRAKGSLPVELLGRF